MSRFLEGLTPATVRDEAAAPRKRRSGTRLSDTCRVCNETLATGADRKLGRHVGCPSSYDEGLLADLKAWRLATAEAAKMPAFVIFTDATLIAIAERLPSSEDDLLQIPGVGRSKLARHGDDVLAVLRSHASR